MEKCDIIMCMALIVIAILNGLTYGKISKTEKFDAKASPPSSAGSGSWIKGSTADCQDMFKYLGCGPEVDCCECGKEDDGPYYYCDGQEMKAFGVLGTADPHCKAPFAVNYNQCSSPQLPGPPLCGGSLPNDCDYPTVCSKKPGLPFGAAGVCQ